mmetsp:Transcript_16917/g.28020  ORF Transcript_16917/g.28020 Transcript_16917/m.28020 type:complete len:99 (-) Transcript_16917:1894-2190(-)
MPCNAFAAHSRDRIHQAPQTRRPAKRTSRTGGLREASGPPAGAGAPTPVAEAPEGDSARTGEGPPKVRRRFDSEPLAAGFNSRTWTFPPSSADAQLRS